MKNKKILLGGKELPTHYYNVVADMPNKPLPPLHPGLCKPGALSPLPKPTTPLLLPFRKPNAAKKFEGVHQKKKTRF